MTISSEASCTGTPLVLLRAAATAAATASATAAARPLYAKVEFMGPSASAKDRKAASVIRTLLGTADSSDARLPSQLVVGCTGPFALSIATLAAGRAQTVAALPETSSADTVHLLKALGAEIVRTPAAARRNAPESHMSTAKRIAEQSRDAVLVEETFTKESYDGIVGEIRSQLQLGSGSSHSPVALVSHVDSAEDLEALAGAVQAVFPDAKTIGVLVATDGAARKPSATLLASAGNAELVSVSERDAMIAARQTMRDSGLLCGVASGAVVHAAKHLQVQSPPANDDGAPVVVIMGDSARQYSSTLLNPAWLLENDIHDTQLQEEIGRKYRGASVEDLQLPEAVCVYATDSIAHAMDIMIARDFSQLPVTNAKRKIIGLVSLGRLTADMASGELVDVESEPISARMYSFAKHRSAGEPYRIVSPGTPLAEIEHFFDKHPAAVVTDESGKFPLAVVTKLDLMRFLSKRGV